MRNLYHKLIGWTLHVLGSWVGFWSACGLLWGSLILFVTASERVEYGGDLDYVRDYALPVGTALLGGIVVALHRAFAGFPRPGKSR